jgi:hypothetical protein
VCKVSKLFQETGVFPISFHMLYHILIIFSSFDLLKQIISTWSQGKSCMLVAGDVYRPAAIDQLTILGKQVPEFCFIEAVDKLQFYDFCCLLLWNTKCICSRVEWHVSLVTAIMLISIRGAFASCSVFNDLSRSKNMKETWEVLWAFLFFNKLDSGT